MHACPRFEGAAGETSRGTELRTTPVMIPEITGPLLLMRLTPAAMRHLFIDQYCRHLSQGERTTEHLNYLLSRLLLSICTSQRLTKPKKQGSP